MCLQAAHLPIEYSDNLHQKIAVLNIVDTLFFQVSFLVYGRCSHIVDCLLYNLPRLIVFCTGVDMYLLCPETKKALNFDEVSKPNQWSYQKS